MTKWQIPSFNNMKILFKFSFAFENCFDDYYNIYVLIVSLFFSFYTSIFMSTELGIFASWNGHIYVRYNTVDFSCTSW